MKSNQTTAQKPEDNKAVIAVFGLGCSGVGFSPRHETME